MPQYPLGERLIGKTENLEAVRLGVWSCLAAEGWYVDVTIVSPSSAASMLYMAEWPLPFRHCIFTSHSLPYKPYTLSSHYHPTWV